MKPEVRPYQIGRSTDLSNRVQQIRRDNDTVKVSKITIYDIDYAIYYHLAENVKPRVNENGISIPVPIMFANGEKWSQIRQHGYLRDNSKKVLAPVMIIRRTGITQDDRLPMVDLNLFTPAYGVFSPKIKVIPMRTSGMQFDRIAGQYQRKESLEYYVTDVPDYVRVTYELLIWTDYQEQMNDLIHPIIGISDHVWGDFYKFRVNVSDISHDNVNVPGEDRLVKSTISMTADGYLRSEYDYQQSKIAKQYSIKTVKFLSEGTEQIIQDNPQDIQSNKIENIADRIDTGLRKNI